MTLPYLEVLRLGDGECLPTSANHVTILSSAQIRLFSERYRRHPLESSLGIVNVLQDRDAPAFLDRISAGGHDGVGQCKEKQGEKENAGRATDPTARSFSVRHCFADAYVRKLLDEWRHCLAKYDNGQQ